MKVKKIERNSLDPKEKKEIKGKYKEVGHRKLRGVGRRTEKQRRLEIHACLKK